MRLDILTSQLVHQGHSRRTVNYAIALAQDTYGMQGDDVDAGFADAVREHLRDYTPEHLRDITAERDREFDALLPTHDWALREAQRRVKKAERRLSKSRDDRADAIRAAVAAGVSKYRVAQILGLGRPAVDAALERGESAD